MSTFVVGFNASGGTGVDVEGLNHMSAGPVVNIVAEDADDLNQTLDDIAALLCCDCINLPAPRVPGTAGRRLAGGHGRDRRAC